MSFEAQPQQPLPSGSGPGSRLAQARAQRGLSLEEAARVLRLSPRHLQALERDDYEHLPGPTYVRGYLRNYAKLLGLPVEEIVAHYNTLAVAQQPVDLGRFAPPAQMASDHRWVRPVTALVLGLIVTLAGLWWYGDREPVAPAPAVRSSAPLGSESPGAISDRASAKPHEEHGPDTKEVLPPSGQAPPHASSRAAAEAAGSRETSLGPPAAATAATRAAAATPDRIAPTPSVPPAPGGGAGVRARLVLQAEQASWAEVRDAAGNRLLYETIPAGRTLSVEGSAPLSVFLGNVDGVRVEFNGKPYDAARHKRGPVARFTLGEAQTTRLPDATR